MDTTLLAFWIPGPLEVGVLAAITLLLFGKRIAGMISTTGRSIGEFKKGLWEKKDHEKT